MNKIFSIIGVAALLATSSLLAQTATNPPSSTGLFGDIGGVFADLGLPTSATNYAAAPFFGKSFNGRNESAIGTVVFADLNSNISLAGGMDQLFGGGKANSENMISGGLSVKESFYPYRWISTNTTTWASSVKVTVYAVQLFGTPTSNAATGSSGIASITRTGGIADVYSTHGFTFSVGGDYGLRQGAGTYNGHWGDLVATVRYHTSF